MGIEFSMPVCFCVQVQLELSRRVANCNFGQSLCKTRHPESCKNATPWWQIWQKQANALRLAFNTLLGLWWSAHKTNGAKIPPPCGQNALFFPQMQVSVVAMLASFVECCAKRCVGNHSFCFANFRHGFCVSFCQ